MAKAARQKKALFPIGVSNFRKLVTHRNSEGNAYLFVDKTLFIKEFIDAGDEITLITRPRRFGKSLTLSMLQHFLAAEVNRKPTKGLFDGLHISQYTDIMEQQGQYSIIFLTLKEIKGHNFTQFFERLQDVIASLFETHDYLLKSKQITDVQQKKFKQFLTQEATQTKYESALQFLSQLLYRHTGKQVIILLDEYDTPIHDAYVHRYYEEARSLLAAMFGKAFKGNDVLYKALITGILKVAKASLFSELNNVKAYTTLDDPYYASYFGFTEKETDNLLDRAGLPKKAHSLKEMYNGYQIRKKTLYNPFSIISFMATAVLLDEEEIEEALKPYWVNTGGTHLITDIVQHNLANLSPGLMSLIQGKAFTTLINEEVIFDPELRNNPVDFWSVLLLSGYLKVVDKEKTKGNRYTYVLCFPNEEIKQTMEGLVLDVVAGGAHSISMYCQGMKNLIQGDVVGFAAFLKQYVGYVPSYFDTGEKVQELFFHGMMVGMAACFWETYTITSNRQSGFGRYDIALTPKDKKHRGVLLEIKIAQKGEDLQRVATIARKQIESKAYDTEMKKQGIKEILYVGIAFRGKTVAVAS